METADLVLAIAVPLVAMLAGWVGVEISLTPPEQQTSAQRRKYRAVFILLMLTAIGLNIWQTARNARQQTEAKNEYQHKQGELTNKVSEQGGKLDAIAHFEQQFLTFVSQSPRPSGSTPDAQAKAYEAMALAVMKMAQGSGSPNAAPDVRIQLTYELHDLNGQTLYAPTRYTTTDGKPTPNAPTPQWFQLSEFRVTNNGSHISGALSARLYLSKTTQTMAADWETTASDEPNFPAAFYTAGKMAPIYVNAQETWNWPPFSGIALFEPNDSIQAMLKVFYGADKPAVARFTIHKKG